MLLLTAYSSVSAQTGASDSARNSSLDRKVYGSIAHEPEALPWNAHLSVAVGAYKPVGDFFGGTGIGFLVSSAITIAASSHYAIRLPVSYSFSTLEPNVNFSALNLSIGPMYFSRISEHSRHPGEWYLYTGVGVAKYFSSVKYFYYYGPSGGSGQQIYGYKQRYDDQHFLFDISGGVHLMTSETVATEFQVEIPAIFTEGSGGLAPSFLFSVQLGAVFYLGKQQDKKEEREGFE